MSTPEMIRVDSAVQRLVAEHAVAMAREMESAANRAADGKVLHTCEKLVLERGRELMRTALEATLQAQADQVEKKGRPPGLATAASRLTTKAATRASS